MEPRSSIADPEKVFLVRADLRTRPCPDLSDSMDELASLARTAGGEVAGVGVQKLDRPVSETFIGRGKAREWAGDCRHLGIDTVIFYDDLTPGQGRNLEKVFERKILDRTSLILDIFAQRARSREGKLQVELAQLRHVLPRLTRFWTHLSRQKGGIGMRGDGETQLETDRRRVQERIHRITRDLERVRRHRSIQRGRRQRRLWPLASIIGYTNAGKTTLLRQLADAGVPGEDKLFATLDPSTRQLRLDTNQRLLLSDTVGFIRELPHSLVDAFKATLEEVAQADLLLHVVDAGHPEALQQIEAVEKVLDEIGAIDKPVLTVFNKCDRLAEMPTSWTERFSPSVRVSATFGTGMDALRAALSRMLRPVRMTVNLRIPIDQSALIARVHEVGQVNHLDYTDDHAEIEARIPPRFMNEFQDCSTDTSN